MQRSPFDLEQQNSDTESRITAALERISEAFRVMLWQEGKNHSLSPIQIQILIFLLNHPPSLRKVSGLADEFNLTRATISDAVKALDRKKLVIKAQDPADSRSQFINLTAQGSAKAKQLSFFATALLEPITHLRNTEKDQLLGSLFTIIRHLYDAGIIPVQRMCFSCKHFSEKDGQHYCNLLRQKLAKKDLRLDCPEYQEIVKAPGG